MKPNTDGSYVSASILWSNYTTICTSGSNLKMRTRKLQINKVGTGENVHLFLNRNAVITVIPLALLVEAAELGDATRLSFKEPFSDSRVIPVLCQDCLSSSLL